MTLVFRRLRRARARGFGAIVALVGLWCADSAVASPRPAIFNQYVLTTWTDKDGLPASWILSLTQDRDGYIWLGTENGLIRFDGVRFEHFDTPRGTKLMPRYISSLCASRDGSLWVGFSGGGGISRINRGRVTNYTTQDGLPTHAVSDVVEDRQGRIWAATRTGLFRLAGGRWEQKGPSEGSAASAYVDPGGTLWVGTIDGVYRWDENSQLFQPVDQSVRHSPAFSQSPAGDLWVTDPLVGFRKLDADPSRRPSTSGYGNRLLHDRDGNLWVSTQGHGLWFLRNAAGSTDPVEMVGPDAGLTSAEVRSLYEDRDGNVWVGTTVGLHKFSRRRVDSITDLGVVRALDVQPNGDVWVGTTMGLVRFAGTTRRSFDVRDGLPSGLMRAVHVGLDGAVWVATDGGIARYVDGRFVPLPIAREDWRGHRIKMMAVDLSGSVWMIDLDRGLLRWANNQLESLEAPAVFGGVIDSVFCDRSGVVWLVIAGGGIGRFNRAGGFESLRTGDGVHLSDLPIYQDQSGAIWFGGGNRLTRFRDGKLDAATLGRQFPADAILTLTGDNDGQLWIGTSVGIVRLDPGEFDKTLSNSTHQLDFRLYDSSDGLAGMPVGMSYRDAVRGRDGRLWFHTGSGLTIVEPRRLVESRPPPPVRIEHVTGDGRAFDLSDLVALPPGTRSLQLDYTALTFFSPSKVQFRYLLQGFDKAWVDAGTRRQAFYTNLPPRGYRFRVSARSSEGVWNEAEAALDFVIAPTFYQTRTFGALCAAAIAVGVFTGWRLRLRQVHRQFALVLGERLRLSREIHDTLLQSLVGVALQLDVVHGGDLPQALKQHLARIRDQVERYIREARQSIWNLRSPALETQDLPNALRQAGIDAVQGKSIAFDYRVSGNVRICPPDVEEQLLRIAQEAITNAVRHAQPRAIRAELHYDVDSLRLRIMDDGCGFDARRSVPSADGHCGLLIMQERAAQVGGVLHVFSQPSRGTEVETAIPLIEGTRQSHVEPAY